MVCSKFDMSVCVSHANQLLVEHKFHTRHLVLRCPIDDTDNEVPALQISDDDADNDDEDDDDPDGDNEELNELETID